MGDNPITYTEIDAYCRVTRALMEPWEARAIIDVYWTYRSAIPAKGMNGLRNETDVRDGAGVKALMSGLASQVDKGRKAKG